MSSWLRELEQIETPLPMAVLNTKVYTLFKKIDNLDEIPIDKEFSFKERAAQLLERWIESWMREDPITTPSPAPPISDRGFELNAIMDNQEPIGSSDAQQPLDNKAEASVIGIRLIKDVQPEIVAESEPSCKPTSDHSTEPSEIPPQQSPLVFTARHPSKSTSEREVIDLTNNEPDTDARSKQPPKPASHHSSELGVVKGEQTIRSDLPLGKYFSMLFINDLTYKWRF
jgi:hypothetical protein